MNNDKKDEYGFDEFESNELNSQEPSLPEEEKVESVFKNKNFVLLFIGNLVSNLGTGMYNFAISLYILFITDLNAAAAGMYMMFGGIVFFAVTPFAGAIVDRLDKVKVVYVTDLINGIAVLGAGIIIFTGISTNQILLVLYITSFILGVNGALFNPAASSLPAHIVDDNQLQQSSSSMQGLRAVYGILALFLGGLMYEYIKIEYIFMINGISFILSGFSEFFITTKTKPDGEHKITMKRTIIDIKEGFTYLKGLKPIFMLVIVASLLNFFTVPVIANGLPYLFEAELKVEAYYFSILMAMYPLGVMISSVYLGTSKQKERVSPMMFKGLYGMAFSFILVSAATYFHLNGTISFIVFMIGSSLSVIVTGWFNGFVNVPFSVAIMKTVDKEMMGRVFSVVTLISNGLTPIAIGLGGFALMYFGINNLFFIAVIAMFVTAFIASNNKYIQQL